MSSRRRARTAAGQRTAPDQATITVCRGCCCGSVAKHPDVDHAAQVARLRSASPSAARVRVSDCLDACERSNVMVVSPSALGRQAGARPVWLGEVLDEDATADVVAWVEAGGPGVVEPPGMLDLYLFEPSNRVRKAVNE